MAAEEVPIPADLVGPDQPPFTGSELVLVLTRDDPEGGASNGSIERVERWSIEHEGQAAWAMAHAAEATLLIAQTEAQYEEWHDRLVRWLEDATREARASLDFFEGHLRRWAIEKRTDRVKSFALPAGTVSTKAGSVTYSVTDDQALFDWLDDLDGPINTEEVAPWKRSVNLTKLRGLLTTDKDYNPVWVDSNGEPHEVPGVQVNVGETTAKVKVEP